MSSALWPKLSDLCMSEYELNVYVSEVWFVLIRFRLRIFIVNI